MVEFRDSSDAIFRALADPTRRNIIERLSRGELTIGALAEPLDMSFAAVSKHVGILADAGLVERTAKGRERVCSLDPEGLLAVRNWTERYVGFWNSRLDALDAALKEETDD